MATERTDVYSRWGKAPVGGKSYHLLIWHLLDVAAVAQRYLGRNEMMRRRLAALLRCDEDEALAVVSRAIGLHDLGKASGAFQSLRPDLVKRLTGTPDQGGWSRCHHPDLTVPLLDRTLGGSLDEVQRRLAQAAAGHHGLPVQLVSDERFWDFARSVDVDVAREMLLAVDACVGVPPSLAATSDTNHATWLVAGLTVLADWIGSNEKFFPLVSDPVPVRAYWNATLDRADKALADTGVLPVPSATRMASSALIGWAPEELHPMQRTA